MDAPLSSFAFNFNLLSYTVGPDKFGATADEFTLKMAGALAGSHFSST
jgi:hypothetical protein